MKIRIALSIIFCALFIRVNAETTKIWRVHTNVTIGSRFWDSLVIVGGFSFNGSMTTAVAMPKDDSNEFCELIYPLDKLPISNDDSNQTSEEQCVDEELLAKMDRVFWADPRNWDLTVQNEAIPHIERIPCNTDRVRIPNTTSTFLIMPSKPVLLTSLSFGSMFVSKYSWKRYLTNEYFMRHFLVKSSLDLESAFNFSTYGCDDRAGCECGTKDYQDEICPFLEDSCAKNLPCETPIKPIGHCCHICGATVMIWFDREKFIYRKLLPVVQKFVQTQSALLNIKTDWYMSRISKSTVQVVVSPLNEYSIQLLDLAQGLSLYLEKAGNLGIEICYADLAGKPIGGGLEWWTTIKIFVALAAVSIGGILFVYLKKFQFMDGVIPFFKGFKYEQSKEDRNNQINNSKTKKNEVNAEKTESLNENVTETESTTTTTLNESTNLIDTSG